LAANDSAKALPNVVASDIEEVYIRPKRAPQACDARNKAAPVKLIELVAITPPCYISHVGVIRRFSSGVGGLDLGPWLRPLSSRLLVTAVLSALAVTAVGCGSSTNSATTAPPATTGAATPTTSASPTTSAAPTTSSTPTATTGAPTSGLSGTWSGQYSGAYQGTFTLTWQQSGANLVGTIKLSSPARTLGITGNVVGSAIRFGAVGGVTYSGTVSGNTMSGTYQTPTAQGSVGSGSWSATKTS
jgi:hypothetical protein